MIPNMRTLRIAILVALGPVVGAWASSPPPTAEALHARAVAEAPFFEALLDCADPKYVLYGLRRLSADMKAKPSAVGRIVRLLDESEDPRVKAAAASALARAPEIAPEALDPLMDLLNSREAEARDAAVRALGRLRERAAPAVPELLRMLATEATETRWSILETLAAIGPGAREAVSALIPYADDPDTRTGYRALDALAALGPDAAPAAPKLMEILERAVAALHLESSAETFHQIRLAEPAIRAIAGLGANAPKEAVPFLLEAMRSPGVDLFTGALRSAACRAAPIFPDEAALLAPEMIRLIGHGASQVERWIAEAAREALAAFGEDALPFLLEFAGKSSPTLAMAAIETIGMIEPPPEDAYQFLLDTLDTAWASGDNDLARCALDALAPFGTRARSLAPGVIEWAPSVDWWVGAWNPYEAYARIEDPAVAARELRRLLEEGTRHGWGVVPALALLPPAHLPSADEVFRWMEAYPEESGEFRFHPPFWEKLLEALGPTAAERVAELIVETSIARRDARRDASIEPSPGPGLSEYEQKRLQFERAFMEGGLRFLRALGEEAADAVPILERMPREAVSQQFIATLAAISPPSAERWILLRGIWTPERIRGLAAIVRDPGHPDRLEALNATERYDSWHEYGARRDEPQRPPEPEDSEYAPLVEAIREALTAEEPEVRLAAIRACLQPWYRYSEGAFDSLRPFLDSNDPNEKCAAWNTVHGILLVAEPAKVFSTAEPFLQDELPLVRFAARHALMDLMSRTGNWDKLRLDGVMASVRAERESDERSRFFMNFGNWFRLDDFDEPSADLREILVHLRDQGTRLDSDLERAAQAVLDDWQRSADRRIGELERESELAALSLDDLIGRVERAESFAADPFIEELGRRGEDALSAAPTLRKFLEADSFSGPSREAVRAALFKIAPDDPEIVKRIWQAELEGERNPNFMPLETTKIGPRSFPGVLVAMEDPQLFERGLASLREFVAADAGIWEVVAYVLCDPQSRYRKIMAKAVAEMADPSDAVVARLRALCSTEWNDGARLDASDALLRHEPESAAALDALAEYLGKNTVGYEEEVLHALGIAARRNVTDPRILVAAERLESDANWRIVTAARDFLAGIRTRKPAP